MISKQTRRNFIQTVSLGVPGIYLMPVLSGCVSADERYYAKAMGCFMGAAIGDADSIATNTAAWLGAMSGIEVWPKEWVEQVQKANLADFDLKQTCEDLINKC